MLAMRCTRDWRLMEINPGFRMLIIKENQRWPPSTCRRFKKLHCSACWSSLAVRILIHVAIFFSSFSWCSYYIYFTFCCTDVKSYAAVFGKINNACNSSSHCICIVIAGLGTSQSNIGISNPTHNVPHANCTSIWTLQSRRWSIQRQWEDTFAPITAGSVLVTRQRTGKACLSVGTWTFQQARMVAAA